MASPATHFRRVTTRKLTSGLEVDLRRPNLQRIILSAPSGSIPDPLTKRVLDQLTQGKKAVQKADKLGLTQADLPKLGSFMELIIKSAMAAPTIVDANPDYEAGQITLDDLTDDERSEIFNWALPQGMDEELAAASTFPA